MLVGLRLFRRFCPPSWSKKSNAVELKSLKTSSCLLESFTWLLSARSVVYNVDGVAAYECSATDIEIASDDGDNVDDEATDDFGTIDEGGATADDVAAWVKVLLMILVVLIMMMMMLIMVVNMMVIMIGIPLMMVLFFAMVLQIIMLMV